MEVIREGVEFHEVDSQGNPAHFYTVNGERVSFSLTQVISLAGLARQPQSDKERLAWEAKSKIGNKVHEYTLWDDQGELDIEDLKDFPDYYNRVLGWRQFKDDFKFEPNLKDCEVPIAVRVNGMLYAMKVDAFGAIGEDENVCLAVVEKKCTAEFSPSYALQAAGEALAFQAQAKELNIPLKRYCVRLLSEKNQANRFYDVKEYTDRMDEKYFVGAGLTNVYYRLQNGLLKGEN